MSGCAKRPAQALLPLNPFPLHTARPRACRGVPLHGFAAPADLPLFAMGLSRGGAVVLTAALKEVRR